LRSLRAPNARATLCHCEDTANAGKINGLLRCPGAGSMEINGTGVARSAKGAGMEAPLSTKPIRRVLKWQASATVAMAAVAGIWTGGDWAAALSAALGGIVSITAVVVYAVVFGLSNPSTAGGTIIALFRAEASKILVIIGELWLVLTAYKDIVPVAFFATFVITVLLFRMALLDRD
jgi:F0F1-type ATP synthase assembly protein I